MKLGPPVGGHLGERPEKSLEACLSRTGKSRKVSVYFLIILIDSMQLYIEPEGGASLVAQR